MPLRRKVTSYALLAGVVVVAVGCLPNDRRNSHCDPGNSNIEEDSDCIYADGQGPQVAQLDCISTLSEPPADCPSFNDVYGILNDANRGQCTTAGCHGTGDVESAPFGIWFPESDPTTTHASLLAATGTVGKPYVNPADPSDSWMQCNVRGVPGGGSPMPKPSGLMEEADALLIEQWIFCGAPGP